MPETLAAISLAVLRNRITRVMPEQIRAAVATMSDDQLWWRPNETSNSVANILIHLTGSLNHYLNFFVGKIEYERDRDGEFAERRNLPRAELLASFEQMIANAEKTLDALTPESLSDPAADPRYSLLVEDLLAVALHISNHTGQIVWIAKMLHDGALDDVWIRSHQREGAWKRT
ncbi:MAG: hypothetical protein JWO97_3620 [Acidobacteria bacterium]|nr:hypothetical protein [Acidobacteriota bacterium]